MNKSHNKKRNVGLVYEFLVRYISRALVENRQDEAQKAVDILNRRFKNGTELYREFRLFNSLLTTSITSANVVASIILEARNAAKRCDIKKLDREKSMLIREINHQLQDPVFFNQPINDYRMYATIQTLLNDWRSGGEVNISQMATFEDNLSQWLLSEKVKLPDLDNHRDSEVNDIVVNVMVEKLAQKYRGILSDRQRELIKVYAASTQLSDDTGVFNTMCEIRHDTGVAIGQYLLNDEIDEHLGQKLADAKKLLSLPEVHEVSDPNVERHLKFIKLVEEIQA